MLIIKVFEIYARGSNYPLQEPTLAQLIFAVPRLSTGYLPSFKLRYNNDNIDAPCSCITHL